MLLTSTWARAPSTGAPGTLPPRPTLTLAALRPAAFPSGVFRISAPGPKPFRVATSSYPPGATLRNSNAPVSLLTGALRIVIVPLVLLRWYIETCAPDAGRPPFNTWPRIFTGRASRTVRFTPPTFPPARRSTGVAAVTSSVPGKYTGKEMLESSTTAPGGGGGGGGGATPGPPTKSGPAPPPVTVIRVTPPTPSCGPPGPRIPPAPRAAVNMMVPPGSTTTESVPCALMMYWPGCIQKRRYSPRSFVLMFWNGVSERRPS